MRRVKVILNQDVYNLGEEGDVREVAPGYARNYLIPQGFALQYSKKNLSYFEQRREAIEKRKEQKREEAKSFKERIESKVLEMEMPAGNTGKLFGSVNSATIAEKLASEGISIERKKIDVPDNNIKMIGEHDVRIRLYGDEVAEIKVIVYPVGGKKAAEDAAKKAAEEAAAAEQAASQPAEAAAGEAGAEAAAEAVPQEAVESGVPETAEEAPAPETAEEAGVPEPAEETAPPEPVSEEAAETEPASAEAAKSETEGKESGEEETAESGAAEEDSK